MACSEETVVDPRSSGRSDRIAADRRCSAVSVDARAMWTVVVVRAEDAHWEQLTDDDEAGSRSSGPRIRALFALSMPVSSAGRASALGSLQVRSGRQHGQLPWVRRPVA